MRKESHFLFCAIILAVDHPNATALGAVQYAKRFAHDYDGQSCALIIGPMAQRAIEQVQGSGLHEIWGEESTEQYDHPQSHQLVDKLFEAIHEHIISQHPRILFFIDSDPENEEVASRLSARLGGLALGRCEKIQIDDTGGVTATKASFGGRVLSERHFSEKNILIAAVRECEEPVILTKTPASSAVIHSFQLNNVVRDALKTVIQPASERHAALVGSKIIISGGRGIGHAGTFEMLFKIADHVGGAVAGTLPAVDAGWVAVSRQVGQSGQYVRPDVYVAFGVSGTPQHMAGIDPHTKIVAINNDPDASIFNIATLGIVADCSVFLPELINALE